MELLSLIPPGEHRASLHSSTAVARASAGQWICGLRWWPPHHGGLCPAPPWGSAGHPHHKGRRPSPWGSTGYPHGSLRAIRMVVCRPSPQQESVGRPHRSLWTISTMGVCRPSPWGFLGHPQASRGYCTCHVLCIALLGAQLPWLRRWLSTPLPSPPSWKSLSSLLDVLHFTLSFHQDG